MIVVPQWPTFSLSYLPQAPVLADAAVAATRMARGKPAAPPREDCVAVRTAGPTRRGKLVLGASLCAFAKYFGASDAIVAGAFAYTLYWAFLRKDAGFKLVEGAAAEKIIAGAGAGAYKDGKKAR